MRKRSSLKFVLVMVLCLFAFVLVGSAEPVQPTAPDSYPYFGWHTAADAPFAFTRFDAEYSPTTGLVYILGGRLADGSTSGRVWSFNPLTGVYTDTGVNMPTPVSNYTIARLTDSIGDEVMVLFGGRPGAGGTTNVVQGYYPATNTVTTFASDPYPVSTAPGSVEVVNNIAYSFGGFDGIAVIANTYIFNITAAPGNRWTTGPNLGVARSYIPSAVVDGVIYALGGDDFRGAALIALTITERLDTNATTLAWDDAGVADLPIACDEARAFGFDTASSWDLAGAIVMAGCGQWPEELAESMLYDVAADTWDTAFPDLNLKRRNHAGAFVPSGPGGYGTPGMWVWGGRFDSDATLRTTPEFYDVNALGNFDLVPPAQTVIGRFGVDVPQAIFNNSGAGDTFNMSYANTQGWTMTGPSTVTVANGDWSYVGLEVEVPGGAACGAFTDVTVTATGQANPSLVDTAVARVEADCVGTLAGNVSDANTGLGIEFATVTLISPSDPNFFEETFTDADGDYVISDLNTGNYEVIASANGYELPAGYQPVTVNLGGNIYDFILDAPIMGWSHNSFSVTAGPNTVRTHTLTISNTGTADLNFSLGTYLDGILPPPPPQQPQDGGLSGVDPRILANLDMGATTEFIVYMDEQADLSAAYEIADWNARGEFVYNQLVETAERSQQGVRALLTTEGVSYRTFFAANALLVEGDLNLVNRLAAREDVAYLMANASVPLHTERAGLLSQLTRTVQSVVTPEAVEWGVARVNADDVWTTYGATGQGVVVANIDTGVFWTHTALVNQYRGGVGNHNYNWYHPTSPLGCDGSAQPCDNDSHGTHTMGTMVGDDGGTNQIGVAPGAKWIACKGCEFNSCSFEALLACGDWMVAPTDLAGNNPDPTKRPHVVNNSWGGGGGDFWYGNVVGAWRAAGIFPQFSAGNSGPNCSTTGSPGDYWMSQAAGATDIGDNIAGFSSRGPSDNWDVLKPDVSAPGVSVRSSTAGGGYANFSGTSMASPHVAGVTALLWSAVPTMTGQIEDTMWLLQQSADPQFTNDICGGDTPTTHPNHTFGWGIVDALAAVDTAMMGDITVPWLAVSPMGGTIPPGGSMTINLVVTAPANVGNYTGYIQLTADEPYNHDVRIDFNLEVMYQTYLPVAKP